MTTIQDTIASTALAQVGYREGHNASGWNNQEKYATQVPGLSWADGQPWCAVFTSWVYLTSKLSAEEYPSTAACNTAAAWYRKNATVSEYPAYGAQVLFGSLSNLVHTGIVIGYDATYVYTVEGNTNTTGAAEGNGVYQMKHVRTSPYVAMYGYPKFPEGIYSADPKAKLHAPVYGHHS